jgi:NADH:ubiquinone oxidoreductase subunit 6 (subunit J)
MDYLNRLARFLFVDNGPECAAVLIGFVAVYLLLPRPRGGANRIWGSIAAGVALLITGALIVRVGRFNPETVLFYAFSGIAILSGGLLITQSNPARAALSFALVVLSTCGIFLLQAAPFLMAATTIIYAGAIIVTFLFVIMLAQQEGPSSADQRSREPLLASLTGFVLLGALLYVLGSSYGTGELDTLLDRVHEAMQKDTVAEMARTLSIDGATDEEKDKLEEKFFEGFKKDLRFSRGRVSTAPNSPFLAEEVDNDNIRPAWVAARRANDAKRAKEVLERLEKVGREGRESLGALQPTAPVAALSNLSGPPANQALEPPLDTDTKAAPALRRDAEGRPQMPHENTAYLGRALFTDNLLAVELAGTLLLVATIGAIAIAARRPEKSA